MLTYKCHRCGADNQIVNQCRCDPNNLPTKVEGYYPIIRYQAYQNRHDGLWMIWDELFGFCVTNHLSEEVAKQNAANLNAEYNSRKSG